jgi:hypothetical protein
MLPAGARIARSSTEPSYTKSVSIKEDTANRPNARSVGQWQQNQALVLSRAKMRDHDEGRSHHRSACRRLRTDSVRMPDCGHLTSVLIPPTGVKAAELLRPASQNARSSRNSSRSGALIPCAGSEQTRTAPSPPPEKAQSACSAVRAAQQLL